MTTQAHVTIRARKTHARAPDHGAGKHQDEQIREAFDKLETSAGDDEGVTERGREIHVKMERGGAGAYVPICSWKMLQACRATLLRL